MYNPLCCFECGYDSFLSPHLLLKSLYLQSKICMSRMKLLREEFKEIPQRNFFERNFTKVTNTSPGDIYLTR